MPFENDRGPTAQVLIFRKTDHAVGELQHFEAERVGLQIHIVAHGAGDPRTEAFPRTRCGPFSDGPGHGSQGILIRHRFTSSAGRLRLGSGKSPKPACPGRTVQGKMLAVGAARRKVAVPAVHCTSRSILKGLSWAAACRNSSEAGYTRDVNSDSGREKLVQRVRLVREAPALHNFAVFDPHEVTATQVNGFAFPFTL